MNRFLENLSFYAGVFALFLVGFGTTSSARAEVRVVASVPSLGALVQEVGGDLVHVDTLAAPNQDPHFVDARPNFVLLLHRADLLVQVGLGLEVGWLPPLLTNSRNAAIQLGRPGNLDTSTVCGPLLGVPQGAVDRSMGDVHPGGNPHFLYDPAYALRVAQGIADRLSSLDSAHAANYQANYHAFEGRLQAKMTEWQHLAAPYHGQKFVAFHESTIYLAQFLGLREAGFIEPQPGISPNPRHLAQIILSMRHDGVHLVLGEPWYDAETSRVVAERANASLVRLPGDVGANGVHSYIELLDHIVRSITQALASHG